MSTCACAGTPTLVFRLRLDGIRIGVATDRSVKLANRREGALLIPVEPSSALDSYGVHSTILERNFLISEHVLVLLLRG